jgi:hypothetical protein
VLGAGDLYPDESLQSVCDTANTIITAYVVLEDDEEPAPVREAALTLAVDIWQSRVAPGGQLNAVDFTPGPYRMGRSMLARVSGLLAPWMATESMIG